MRITLGKNFIREGYTHGDHCPVRLLAIQLTTSDHKRLDSNQAIET